MISVLIPTYNYDITKLVAALHHQLSKASIEFEIICFDDGSKNDISSKNKVIEALSHTRYIISTTNIGRVKARMKLAKEALFSWLLFIDADTLPKTEQFISNYLVYTNQDFDVVFGGFAYSKDTPKNNEILRWKYGKKHEEVPSEIRNLSPYKVIISANYLIRKKIFQSFKFLEAHKTYGQDSLLGSKLKEAQVKVYHIDNEVWHLGLEDNLTFLEKKEQASRVLLDMYRSSYFQHNPDNHLLNLFAQLKRLKLSWLFYRLYQLCYRKWQKNLLGNHPNIKLLQMYRLSYLCYLDHTTSS